MSTLGLRAAARERFRVAAVAYGACGRGSATAGASDGGSERSSRSGCAADVDRAEAVARIRRYPAAARLTRDVTMLYLDAAAHSHNIEKEQAFGWFSSREFHTLCEARDDFGDRLFEC